MNKQNLKIDGSKVLCIGDGLRTDIKGANYQNLDSLFIANGLEKQHLIGGNGELDLIKLNVFFKEKIEKPDFVIDYLK